MKKKKREKLLKKAKDLPGFAVPLLWTTEMVDSEFVFIADNCMAGSGILKGDMLLVDRAAEPETGDIIVAVLDGTEQIRRFTRENGGVIILRTDDPINAPVIIRKDVELEIFGVVASVIRVFNRFVNNSCKMTLEAALAS